MQRRGQMMQDMRARARAVRDQQERGQEERRQHDQAERERLAAVEGCPVPHRNFREQPMTRIEAAAVRNWYAREIARYSEAAAQPPACATCGQPGRLYAAGPLCDQHKPGSTKASAINAE